MNDADLESLLADLESDRVERKESAVDTGRICQAVCAFANDMPGHRASGVLFIGVKDDGKLRKPADNRQVAPRFGQHSFGWQYPSDNLVSREDRGAEPGRAIWPGHV